MTRRKTLTTLPRLGEKHVQGIFWTDFLVVQHKDFRILTVLQLSIVELLVDNTNIDINCPANI